eukprot:13505436-Alexandrium_andersonii.AAC.1
MQGPKLISRFLERGELVGERVPGAFVYHADLGIPRDSDMIPSELVEYEMAGKNVRVLVEGDEGW